MPASKPLVSVIMNCHNGQDFLKESLKSLFLQSYKNWELIFFNNKSSDKTYEILKKFKDKRIRYFESKKYLKLYKARNLAISKSKGLFVTFLDTDDLWNKNKLQKQIEIYEKNKKIKFIYSNFFFLNQKTKVKSIRSNFNLDSGHITQKILNDYYIGLLTAMIKKDIFNKFKFNEGYEIIGDFDFFIKLSLKLKFYSIQEPLATYRVHGSNLSLKKLDIHSKELGNWLKKNSNKLAKLNYSLKKQKIYFFKLKIKSLFRKLI